jgi:hypothetical protein
VCEHVENPTYRAPAPTFINLKYDT